MDITKEALDLLVPVVVVKDSLKNGRFASSVESYTWVIKRVGLWIIMLESSL